MSRLDQPIGSTVGDSDDHLVVTVALIAIGLRRALARAHGLHDAPTAQVATSGEQEWMSADAAPMMSVPGGDAAPAMSRAGLHKQGGPAGAETPTGPSHSEGHSP